MCSMNFKKYRGNKNKTIFGPEIKNPPTLVAKWVLLITEHIIGISIPSLLKYLFAHFPSLIRLCFRNWFRCKGLIFLCE